MMFGLSRPLPDDLRHPAYVHSSFGRSLTTIRRVLEGGVARTPVRGRAGAAQGRHARIAHSRKTRRDTVWNPLDTRATGDSPCVCGGPDRTGRPSVPVRNSFSTSLLPPFSDIFTYAYPRRRHPIHPRTHPLLEGHVSVIDGGGPPPKRGWAYQCAPQRAGESDFSPSAPGHSCQIPSPGDIDAAQLCPQLSLRSAE